MRVIEPKLVPAVEGDDLDYTALNRAQLVEELKQIKIDNSWCPCRIHRCIDALILRLEAQEKQLARVRAAFPDFDQRMATMDLEGL